jgi:hypothetical protein
MNVVKTTDRMNNMDELELLGRLERVEPPPFLFTRIVARLHHESLPRKWVLAAALAACAIIAVNMLALRGAHGDGNTDGAALAVGMGIDASNQLYR